MTGSLDVRQNERTIPDSVRNRFKVIHAAKAASDDNRKYSGDMFLTRSYGFLLLHIFLCFSKGRNSWPTHQQHDRANSQALGEQKSEFILTSITSQFLSIYCRTRHLSPRLCWRAYEKATIPEEEQFVRAVGGEKSIVWVYTEYAEGYSGEDGDSDPMQLNLLQYSHPPLELWQITIYMGSKLNVVSESQIFALFNALSFSLFTPTGQPVAVEDVHLKSREQIMQLPPNSQIGTLWVHFMTSVDEYKGLLLEWKQTKTTDCMERVNCVGEVPSSTPNGDNFRQLRANEGPKSPPGAGVLVIRNTRLCFLWSEWKSTVLRISYNNSLSPKKKTEYRGINQQTAGPKPIGLETAKYFVLEFITPLDLRPITPLFKNQPTT
ncbi:hypothetical protein C8J56DRAFT_882991 [Mycena floridula]|nr:hypothetical protein C8J56DRAFT_882991 [Mycena floridula]